MLNTLLSMLVQKVKDEPAVVTGLVASGLVVLAAKLGIVIDKASLTLVLTPIVTSLATRFFVQPASKAKKVSA